MKRYLVRSVLMGVLALAMTLSMTPGVRAVELKEVFARGLTDHECVDTNWHFVVTGFGNGILPPASIHVIWANGAQADVALDHLAGDVAHYITTLNLDWQVVEASTFVSEAWAGSFRLRHGPCDVIGPGKNTVLGNNGAFDPDDLLDNNGVIGTVRGDDTIHRGKSENHGGNTAELPKTGDAEVQMAALLAALAGAALLLTGTAGRSIFRRA